MVARFVIGLVIVIALSLLMVSCTTYVAADKTPTGYRITTNSNHIIGTLETPTGERMSIDTKKSSTVKDVLQYLLIQRPVTLQKTE